jgi:hypothetical protein
MKFYWIPEALPNHPGMYAPSDYVEIKNEMTNNIFMAMKFESKEKCHQWCLDHIKFVPMQHGLYEEV